MKYGKIRDRAYTSTKLKSRLDPNKILQGNLSNKVTLSRGGAEEKHTDKVKEAI